MERAALVWDPALTAYDLGDAHPLNPLRLELTVELMEAFGLLRADNVIAPKPATEEQLLRVHSIRYIETVHQASEWGSGFAMAMGLGSEDNPIFPGMHDVAALTCGASIAGMEAVLDGRFTRSFSIAGGMHHAHRSRAAGFSVYNDAAVAIAAARAAHPELKVLYIDVDAHHGDGVEEAFAGTSEVMTISIHESGLYAFPGTGFPGEIGYDQGAGFAVNVPLPRFATDECFALAFDEVAAPLARAFAPDIIVAQLGVDAQHTDPQTELGMTIPGYRRLVDSIIELADEACDGRLAALGGGGYHLVDVVPLAWTWVFAELSDVELCEEVPDAWRESIRSRLGCEPPSTMGAGDRFEATPEQTAAAIEATEERIRETRVAVFPYSGLEA